MVSYLALHLYEVLGLRFDSPRVQTILRGHARGRKPKLYPTHVEGAFCTMSRGSSRVEALDTLVIKKKKKKKLSSILHVGNAIKVDLFLLICATEVGDCLSNILVAVLNAF